MTEFYVPPDVPLYLTPDSIPVGRFCRTLRVPDDVQWVALVDGLLSTLANPNMWRQFGTLTREETAEAWLGMLVESWDVFGCASCELPGGGAIVQLDSLGSWRMLDNGDWGDPSGDYAIPAYTARTEPTAEERMCLAAKNAANVLSLVYEQIADDAAAGATVAEMVINVGSVIGLLIAGPIGLLAVQGMRIVIAAAQFALSIAQFITEDVWDADFTNSLVCTLLDNASDDAGVVTFDFQGVREDLLSGLFFIDLTFVTQQLIAQVNFMLATIGAEGLNLAGETTAITDDDCSGCEPTWAYRWDFRVDAGNWTLYPGQPGGIDSTGLYTGLGFAGGNPARGRRQTIWQFLGFPTDAQVLSFYGEQEVDSIGNLEASPTVTSIYTNAFTEAIAIGEPVLGHNGGGMVGEWTGVDSIQITLSVGSCDTCGDPGGQGSWTIFTLSGRGELPTEFFGGEEI